jgi:hypothetical protein
VTRVVKRTGPPRRPAPAEFAAMACANSVNVVRKHYGLSYRLFRRWCDEMGIRAEVSARARVPARPVPADFGQYAPLETNLALSHRYDAAKSTIARWRVETGVPHPPALSANRGTGRPVPDSFPSVAPGMTRAALATHYSASGHVIARWITESGVQPKVWKHHVRTLPPMMTPGADTSVAGQAAQHLRRLMPVFRAAVIDKNCDGYVVGGRQMATDEMIAMAARKGFDPDAWAKI